MGCGASKSKDDKKKDSAPKDNAGDSKSGSADGEAVPVAELPDKALDGVAVHSINGNTTGPKEDSADPLTSRFHGDEVFVDTQFDAHSKSIHLPEDEVPPGTAAIASWARTTTINPDAALFVDGAEGGDVKQGGLASCWYLGALCVLATQDDLLKKIFPQHNLQLGYLRMKFFKECRWLETEIDDRLPVMSDGKTLVFASCVQPREFWVPLAEKAYAKIHNSYASLTLGTIGTGLVDLTGGIHFWRDISSIKIAEHDTLWNELNTMVNSTASSPSRYLLGCSIPGSVEEADESTGLLKGHAYAVISTAVVGPNKTRLVCIRNPWGHGEWTGAWSDNSAEWTDDTLAELGHSFGNDGKFYMSFEDFVNTWGTLDICRILTGPGWSSARINGEWKGDTAAGLFQQAGGQNNRQYLFELHNDAEVIVSLTQYDPRYSGDSKTQNFNIGVDILSTDSDLPLNGFDRSKLIVQSPSWSDQREASISHNMKAGKYIIVPSTYHKKQESSYVLRVYASDSAKFTITPLASQSSLFETWSVDGAWTAQTAGGSTMTRTWHKNPQHLITLRPVSSQDGESGDEDGATAEGDIKVHLKVSLTQRKQKDGKNYGINTLIQKAGTNEELFGRPIFDRDPVVPLTQFVNRDEVWMEFDALVPRTGPVQYSVTPLTFHADELAQYSIKVWAPKGTKDHVQIEISNADPNKWHTIAKASEWKGETAGGCANHRDSWPNNPTLDLIIPEDAGSTLVSVQLIQGDGEDKFPIGLHILDNGDKPVVASSQWAPNYDTSLKAELEPGTYSIRPSTFDPGQENTFELIVRSTAEVKVEVRN